MISLFRSARCNSPIGALQGPHALCVRLRMPHGHGGAGENPAEIKVFADAILKDGTPLASITGSGRDGRKVWATYSARTPIVRGELNYTTDPGRWQDRNWQAIAAVAADGRIEAELPERSLVYYFNLIDARECVVSTEHA